MTSQAAFHAALLDAGLPAPPGLTGPMGAPVGNRFNVYRNNVVMSLTEALQSSFPVVQKLVGEEFFAAMAGLYLRQHPPSSPLLMYYGERMPAFLAGFAPAQRHGYLPDIARLELALRQSYHAADATAIDAAMMAALAAHDLPAARFAFTPRHPADPLGLADPCDLAVQQRNRRAKPGDAARGCSDPAARV